MSQDQNSKAKTTIGLYRRPESGGRLGVHEIIALSLSAVWLGLTTMFFVVLPRDTGGTTEFDPFTFVMTLLAVFMPVALIWVGTSAAKNAKMMREESARLQASIDAMRNAYISKQQENSTGTSTVLEKKLEEIASAQRNTETALAALSGGGNKPSTLPQSTPKAAMQTTPSTPASPPESQPSLALGTPAEALENPITVEDFIRAVHFPESETDKDGFRALRLALRDPNTSGLVRSAQDVLTLLSEDGIYMDDLIPDRSRPEIWRKFAEGERGRTVASLGGVRDRSSLALAAGRMRQDPVFRDAAHHFLRRFDQTFAAFEKTANDSEIAALAETRTARAFMLLGRVAGTFD
jgi:hypothetical protein